jgi:HlyD family secretion protein
VRRFPTLLLAALLSCSFTGPLSAIAQDRSVSSLGRLEPENGVLKLAGPSGGGLTGAVIKEMFVAEGDWVEKDQEVARLDAYAVRKAEIDRINAVIRNARSELERQKNLSTTSATSQSKLETATMELEVAQAELAAAKAFLDLAIVRSPLRAQVLKIHAYPGERVEADGIMELGATDRMFAVAEVYETDITRVEIGQRARVEAPALAAPLLGTVERIALQVGRMDALSADPIAKTDARVVEVFVLLDEPGKVAQLTNMQVEVEIGIQ